MKCYFVVGNEVNIIPSKKELLEMFGSLITDKHLHELEHGIATVIHIDEFESYIIELKTIAEESLNRLADIFYSTPRIQHDDESIVISRYRKGKLHSFNDAPSHINTKTNFFQYHSNGREISAPDINIDKGVLKVIRKRNGAVVYLYPDNLVKTVFNKKTDLTTEHWKKNGKFHREDGPAVFLSNGTCRWYLNGETHRDNDLPAVIFGDGTQAWYKHGKPHRDNPKDPHILHTNGRKEWIDERGGGRYESYDAFKHALFVKRQRENTSVDSRARQLRINELRFKYQQKI